MAVRVADKIKQLNDASFPLMDAKDVIMEDGATVEHKLDNKVDKESGKGLSTNDYTNTDKAKLDTITLESGSISITAPENIVDIKSNTTFYNGIAIASGTIGLNGSWSNMSTHEGLDGNPQTLKEAFDTKADKHNIFGGFVGGDGAITLKGGAVGYGAEAQNGFAGGYNAKTVSYDENGHGAIIDAIQLGTGTNSNENTLQVFDYQLMDAYGNIPTERLNNVRSVNPQVSASLPDMLKVNTIYDLGLRTTLSIQLPNANYGEFIQVDFYSGETPTTLTITSSRGITDIDLIPASNTTYSLFFDWGILYYDTSASSNVKGWRFGYAEYPYVEV